MVMELKNANCSTLIHGTNEAPIAVIWSAVSSVPSTVVL